MDSNTTTTVEATEPVNRFDMIATYLNTTPEKVADLLTRIAAISIYPLDYLVDLVASVVPAAE